MQRYKALIAYDGTNFEGFQRQRPSHRTVQAEVEQALKLILGESISVAGAGRTDSGVHATGQVISFMTVWHHSDQALQNALNAKLPSEIVILKIEQIQAEFHPRFDARKRTYEYLILNTAVRQPLYRHRAWWVKRPLRLETMNEAAAHLLGEHNFSTFGQPPQGHNTVRHIFQAEWTLREPFLLFTIQANAFLYRMVRSIVGSLKLVGENAWSIETFVDAFQQQERSSCGPVAPPQGVYLISVEY